MFKGVSLHLTQNWLVGEPIGKGGFGLVHKASSATTQGAAKFIPNDPGASRELLFVDLHGTQNVVPILDSGEYGEYLVLIMPLADRSLLDFLREKDGALSPSEAMPIFLDIATALVELDGRVVHRDLKPANVLQLDGKWCLADFGISRYAEATTALDTRKHALTYAYAAPERWRSERATTATDVYSLGIMAFELLTGSHPFKCEAPDEYRDAHLHTEPGLAKGVSDSMAALIEECLFKAPEARPSPANLLRRIEKAGTQGDASTGIGALQKANLSEVRHQAASDRAVSEARSKEERREAIGAGAQKSFSRISYGLLRSLRDAAPASSVEITGPNVRHIKDLEVASWRLSLGRAKLTVSGPDIVFSSPQEQLGFPFDVVAIGSVELHCPANGDYSGRSHSLWYCDALHEGDYRWFEISFMTMPLSRKRVDKEPFALGVSQDAAGALMNGIADCQVARPFTPVEIDFLDEFADRWAGLLATAADGSLRRPAGLPEGSPNGSWRHAR